MFSYGTPAEARNFELRVKSIFKEAKENSKLGEPFPVVGFDLLRMPQFSGFLSFPPELRDIPIAPLLLHAYSRNDKLVEKLKVRAADGDYDAALSLFVLAQRALPPSQREVIFSSLGKSLLDRLPDFETNSFSEEVKRWGAVIKKTWDVRLLRT